MLAEHGSTSFRREILSKKAPKKDETLASWAENEGSEKILAKFGECPFYFERSMAP